MGIRAEPLEEVALAVHHGGGFTQEALVVGPRHADVDVVVPGQDGLLEEGADGGAALDEVRDAEHVAHADDFRKNLIERLVEAVELVVGVFAYHDGVRIWIRRRVCS